jgi:hypothetical protein
MRVAADALTAALGLNLWVSLSLVPGMVAGAFSRSGALAVLAPVPLLFLAVGVIRRSPMWLLLAYPTALLLPVAVDARIASSIASGPVVLSLTALSLVGFLFGGAYLTTRGAAGEATPGARSRRLGGSLEAEAPVRWQRRRRIYLALAILSAVFPAMLLYRIGLDADTRAFLLESFPDEHAPGDRAASLLAVMLLAGVGVWLVLWDRAFVGPLRHHRTGDKELVAELDRLRHDARQATPRLGFYVGVVVALALMALLVFMRLGAP